MLLAMRARARATSRVAGPRRCLLAPLAGPLTAVLNTANDGLCDATRISPRPSGGCGEREQKLLLAPCAEARQHLHGVAAAAPAPAASGCTHGPAARGCCFGCCARLASRLLGARGAGGARAACAASPFGQPVRKLGMLADACVRRPLTSGRGTDDRRAPRHRRGMSRPKPARRVQQSRHAGYSKTRACVQGASRCLNAPGCQASCPAQTRCDVVEGVSERPVLAHATCAVAPWGARHSRRVSRGRRVRVHSLSACKSWKCHQWVPSATRAGENNPADTRKFSFTR